MYKLTHVFGRLCSPNKSRKLTSQKGEAHGSRETVTAQRLTEIKHFISRMLTL